MSWEREFPKHIGGHWKVLTRGVMVRFAFEKFSSGNLFEERCLDKSGAGESNGGRDSASPEMFRR